MVFKNLSKNNTRKEAKQEENNGGEKGEREKGKTSLLLNEELLSCPVLLLLSFSLSCSCRLLLLKVMISNIQTGFSTPYISFFYPSIPLQSRISSQKTIQSSILILPRPITSEALSRGPVGPEG